MTEKFNRVQIAVPTGELGKPVNMQLRRAGLAIPVETKQNLVTVDRLGIEMLLIRPSSVPEIVTSERTKTRAGITGGDILWNAGMREQGEPIPTIPNSGTLFIGVTNSLRNRVLDEKGREPVSDDLRGSTIVTKFPGIAGDLFADTVEVWAMPGSTEALQYAVPGCDGILDITATGAAVAANKLHIVKLLMDPVDVRMVEQPGLSSLEERIIADFRDMLIEAEENTRFPVYA